MNGHNNLFEKVGNYVRIQYFYYFFLYSLTFHLNKKKKKKNPIM